MMALKGQFFIRDDRLYHACYKTMLSLCPKLLTYENLEKISGKINFIESIIILSKLITIFYDI